MKLQQFLDEEKKTWSYWERFTQWLYVHVWWRLKIFINSKERKEG